MQSRLAMPSIVRAFWTVITLMLLPPALSVAASGTPVPTAGPACENGTPAAWTRQMDAYVAAGKYPVTQTRNGGTISSVLVDVPPIDFTGAGQSATLPVGPCQTIYRSAYNGVAAPAGAATPFACAQIDWNTEGEPRGPNNSFISPHFDFHFYMLPRSEIDQRLLCVSTNGRTCAQFKTG